MGLSVYTPDRGSGGGEGLFGCCQPSCYGWVGFMLLLLTHRFLCRLGWARFDSRGWVG